MDKKLKSRLLTASKFLFAAAIITYMLATGKLDLHEIASFSHRKMMILKVVLTLAGVYLLVTIRWYYLLKWQGLSTTFKTVLRINCIGLFFNCFMPGAVGGDIVKAFYVAKENTANRTRAIVTIIIDRIMGFETLMLVAFVALIANYRVMSSNIHLKGLGLLVALYIGISIVAAAAVFSRRVKRFLLWIGVKKLVTMLPKKEILFKIYDAFHIYANQKQRLLKAMAITIPLDLLNIYMFYTIGREMGESAVAATSYFTAVPVGLLMLALPVAPAGIGVGQAAFHQLFEWFGADSGQIGATIITVYQIITITVNMGFVVVYLWNKKEVQAAVRAAREEAS
ncbi:MAG: lysylphosphatidylglycerol synthase transmembrane domain-containing protein [Planctomycetota bacterium]